jgi:hypothetical protein
MCNAPTHVRFTPNSDCKSGPPQNVMSALPPKADMCGALTHVCFGPKADIVIRVQINEKASFTSDELFRRDDEVISIPWLTHWRLNGLVDRIDGNIGEAGSRQKTFYFGLFVKTKTVLEDRAANSAPWC